MELGTARNANVTEYSRNIGQKYTWELAYDRRGISNLLDKVDFLRNIKMIGRSPVEKDAGITLYIVQQN